MKEKREVKIKMEMNKINQLPEVGFKFTYKARKSVEQSAEDFVNELNGENENEA